MNYLVDLLTWVALPVVAAHLLLLTLGRPDLTDGLVDRWLWLPLAAFAALALQDLAQGDVHGFLFFTVPTGYYLWAWWTARRGRSQKRRSPALARVRRAGRRLAVVPEAA